MNEFILCECVHICVHVGRIYAYQCICIVYACKSQRRIKGVHIYCSLFPQDRVLHWPWLGCGPANFSNSVFAHSFYQVHVAAPGFFCGCCQLNSDIPTCTASTLTHRTSSPFSTSIGFNSTILLEIDQKNKGKIKRISDPFH